MEKFLIVSKDEASIKEVLDSALEDIGKIVVFTKYWEALSYMIDRKDICGVIVDLDNHACEDMNFIKILRAINSDIGITLISKDGRYAVEGFRFEVVTYLLKPIGKEQIVDAMDKMKDRWIREKRGEIYIQTFGSFSISIRGQTINWRNSKTKELFAYLVDARGDNVSSDIIKKTLWPNVEAKKSSSTFHTTLHNLRKILAKNKIDGLLECSRGSQRVNVDLFKCDFYEFEKEIEKGTKQSYRNAFDLYKGNYLENNAYNWSRLNRIRLQLQFENVCQLIDCPVV